MSKVVVDAQGVEHEFPDEATEAMIAQTLDMTAVRPHVRKKRQKRGLLQTVADVLPIAGGAAGGIVGGTAGAAAGGIGAVPGAMSGAGIGGAGGEAARQLIYHAAGIEGAPETSTEAAKEIFGEGATQSLLELGGRGLAAGARAGGQLLMRTGLRAPIEVAQTAIAHRIAATRKGLMQVKEKIFNQDLITKRHLARAQAQGVEFDPLHIATNAMAKIRGLVQGHKHPQDDALAVAKMAEQFVVNHPGTIKPLVAHQVRRNTSEAAQPIYRKIRSEEQATAGQKLQMMWDKALTESLDDALAAQIPGYKVSNAVTSELIQLKNYVAATQPKKAVPLVARLAGGVALPAAGGATVGFLTGGEGDRLKSTMFGAGVGAAAATVGSKSALSKLALAADPYLAYLMQQTPRVLESAARPPRKRER